MDSINRFCPGTIVVMRGVWKKTLKFACPAYVVRDSPELLALFWPVGTPTKSPVVRPTVEDELLNRGQLKNRSWTDNNVLLLNTPGSAHSVQVMWDGATHIFCCWYVHLQEAMHRTAIGFDTMDQMLDIVIKPDRSWQWKDEDELNEAEMIGVYSHEKAQGIRAEGERVIQLLKSNSPPFCDGWENWRPPTEWTIPTFPVGWENIPT